MCIRRKQTGSAAYDTNQKQNGGLSMKNKVLRMVSMLLALVLLIGMLPSNIQSASAKPKGDGNYIVITKDNGKKKKLKEQKKDKIKKHGRYSNMDENNVLYMDLTKEEAKQLKKDKDILMVEEDFDISLSFALPEDDEMDGYDMSNEPITSEVEKVQTPEEETQWNISAVGVDPQEEAERVIVEENKVKIGILDSGVLTTDEIGMADHLNFIEADDDIIVTYQDYTGHGTGVAGIIGAKLDGKGIVGINPNAELYSLRVFGEENKAPVSRIIEGIMWAIDHDIDVLNMSFSTNVDSKALHYAIQQAYAAGIVMVAAAGNEGGTIQYPAAYEEVISVGSVNQKQTLSDFSATGDNLDVVAPGEDILSTSYLWGYMAADGTSLSAAHVTGLASLILQQNPSLTPAQVKEVLCQSAIPLEENCGSGMVNGKNAYALLASGQPIEPGMEPEISLDEDVPEYEETAYVKGEWSGADHIGLVNGTGITPTYLDMNMVNHYVRYADVYFNGSEYDKDGNKKDNFVLYVRTFHARLNYVATSRFLYSVAYYYYKAAQDGVATILKPEDVFKKTYIQNLKGLSTTYLNQIKEAITHIYNQHENILDKGLVKDNMDMASALMGLAIHTSTDAFAHRTMITAYGRLNSKYFDTSSNANCKETTKARCTHHLVRENELVCKHWGCLVNAIKDKWIDAIDIKYFMKDEVEGEPKDYSKNQVYEDNTNWYPDRFTVASQYATQCLLEYISADPISGWQRKTFTPCYKDAYYYTYDLENLKTYYQEAGLDTSFLTDKEWAGISIEQKENN